MIHFSQLWGLTALVTLPLIVLLFALRPKRRTLVVSTNKLWQEALREQQRGHGLQKLLRELSLLLFLLFALVLSLGLAGLGWTLPATERDDIVVILDVSASMQARGNNGLSRFEDARNQAASVINGLDRNSRLLLMTSGRAATIRTAFESDRATLGQALEDVEVTDEAGDARQAMVLAMSLLRNDERGKIVFITDRAFDNPDDLDTSRIEFKSVEGGSFNLAITGFDFRAEVGSDARFQVLVTVQNYATSAQVPELRIELADKTLLTESLELAPWQQRTLVLPVQGRLSGIATAVLVIDDDLSVDNQAYAVIDTGDRLQVLLVSPGNVYLRSVFSALPNVDVEQMQGFPPDFDAMAKGYDVIVIDSVDSPSALPPGNYLLINTIPDGLPLLDTGQQENPQIVGVGNAALMQDLDMDGLRISRSYTVTHEAESPALQRLFWSDNSSLAMTAIRDGSRMVWLGFDLVDSNFPLHAAFPLFLSESLAWLQGQVVSTARTQILTGDSVGLAMPPGHADVTVRTPAGKLLRFDADDNDIQFRDTARSGIYRYQSGQVDYPFAVNLTDKNESDIQARASHAISTRAPSTVTSSGQTDVPLWPWLVVLALIVSMLEWCLWCWRGAGA